jgi:hypothetical protein
MASVCQGILKPPLLTAIDAGQSKLHLSAGRLARPPVAECDGF